MKKLLIFITALLYTATCLQGMNNARNFAQENNQLASPLCQGFEKIPAHVITIILSFADTPDSIADTEFNRGAHNAYNLEEPSYYLTTSTKLRHSCVLLYQLFDRESTIYTTKWLTQEFYKRLHEINSTMQPDTTELPQDVMQWFATVRQRLLVRPGTMFIFNDYNNNLRRQLTNYILTLAYTDLIQAALVANQYHKFFMLHNGNRSVGYILHPLPEQAYKKLCQLSINLAAHCSLHLHIVIAEALAQSIKILTLSEASSYHLYDAEALIKTLNTHNLTELRIFQKNTAPIKLPAYFKNLNNLETFYLSLSNTYTDHELIGLVNLPTTLKHFIMPDHKWNLAAINEAIAIQSADPTISMLTRHIPQVKNPREIAIVNARYLQTTTNARLKYENFPTLTYDLASRFYDLNNIEIMLIDGLLNFNVINQCPNLKTLVFTSFLGNITQLQQLANTAGAIQHDLYLICYNDKHELSIDKLNDALQKVNKQAIYVDAAELKNNNAYPSQQYVYAERPCSYFLITQAPVFYPTCIIN